jgi:2-C-methyl-D-erythritol 4-phosphate cytidylyltransferase
MLQDKILRSDKTDSKISFLLLSGGIGTRSKHSEPKQFFVLAGHPMIAYSLMAAAAIREIDEILINSPSGYEDLTLKVAEQYCADKVVKVTTGGRTRQHSSWKLAQAASHDTLILHEAARPFVDVVMLRSLIECAADNVSYCQPIPFSMCRIDPVTGHLVENVPRETTLNIQLPQKFARKDLLAAHQQASARGKEYTEDAMMVVDSRGQSVVSLPGSSRNLKVTTPEDFMIAENLITRKNK